MQLNQKVVPEEYQPEMVDSLGNYLNATFEQNIQNMSIKELIVKEIQNSQVNIYYEILKLYKR